MIVPVPIPCRMKRGDDEFGAGRNGFGQPVRLQTDAGDEGRERDGQGIRGMGEKGKGEEESPAENRREKCSSRNKR